MVLKIFKTYRMKAGLSEQKLENQSENRARSLQNTMILTLKRGEIRYKRLVLSAVDIVNIS